jgi:3-phosphoshikimate 1-carboxyvinyltransferase
MGSSTTCWISRPAQGISGRLAVPGDKSVSHRALMLGAIADGPVTVSNFLAGADCIATRRALEQMGGRIEALPGGDIRVEGGGPESLAAPDSPLDLGNSGTGIRLMTGLLAGLSVDAVLTGDASLRSRPMERVARPLRLMGADVTTTDGCPPIRLRPAGRLRGIEYRLPVPSAQVKSAVLLAGLSAEGETVITQPAVSRDHTERMLRAMGAPIVFDETEIRLEGPCRLRGGHIRVPGDFSAAAFFLVAALVAGSDELVLEGVGINPTRVGLLRMLEAMGGDIALLNTRQSGGEPVADLRVRPGRLRGIDVAPEWVPLAIDEFPVFFVAAAVAEGVTRVRGAEELRVKESDRIDAMATALAGVGVAAEPRPDGMLIRGGSIRGGRVDSRGDHRIAMAMAVAGAVSEEGIVIEDTENVATSFPDFMDAASAVGMDVRELDK